MARSRPRSERCRSARSSEALAGLARNQASRQAGADHLAARHQVPPLETVSVSLVLVGGLLPKKVTRLHACAHLSERRPNGWVAAPLSAILQSSHHFRYRVSGIKERKATDFI
jgi:hypothetical protein